MLNWANRFSIFCFLDNHQYQTNPRFVECMLAAGSRRSFSSAAGKGLAAFQQFADEKKSWLFGHLAYDLKNETEKPDSAHGDHLQFPDIFFFEPEVLVRLSEKKMIIEGSDKPEAVFETIIQQPSGQPEEAERKMIKIKQRFSKKEYIRVVNQLKKHILRGDCYEINFCQEFFANNVQIDPLAVYRRLSAVSPNPFSAFYRLHDKFLICASPERFLKKQGCHILSQPIKGTAPRFSDDQTKDKQSRKKLAESKKDQSENVMVVDLVRNDLSRVCSRGTVKVDELYGIYSFPQVYQMISTVSGELKENVSFTDIIRATFPMGSMTGAPKRKVMELIEQYEKTKRGIFSGTLGYITPCGDFDFNVVIRSILYNASAKYLSFMAGSGITFYSDAEKEYEECLLKAEAMKKALNY
jgi:para-aminobenzoate synthetase component 1